MLSPSSNNRTLSCSHKRSFAIFVKGLHNCANTFVSNCTSNDTYIILTHCERITRDLLFSIAPLGVVDKISAISTSSIKSCYSAVTQNTS